MVSLALDCAQVPVSTLLCQTQRHSEWGLVGKLLPRHAPKRQLQLDSCPAADIRFWLWAEQSNCR